MYIHFVKRKCCKLFSKKLRKGLGLQKCAREYGILLTITYYPNRNLTDICNPYSNLHIPNSRNSQFLDIINDCGVDFVFFSGFHSAMGSAIKMTKADFIQNNQGIDNGKDLPEEYLGALYDEVVQNEIKMKADASVPQSKQWNSINKLLGLDGILNLVKKQSQAQRLGANGDLIQHIQKQFKSKSGKSE